MLRNLKSSETYFQAAFRVQSPWEITTDFGTKEILKHECYVFDFALERALKQISDYSCRLNIDESNPEKKVAEFINFLPVLAYDGSSMKQINAQDILDIAMAGTSATLLAKRWESALLVNVDNDTLARLMANEEAMQALMNIEGFRSLNSDIETIINKSESVKKAKKEGQDKLNPKEKRKLTEEEKEYKSIRKKIQEKLIKFATRIPIFMYLTDYRERSLKDVITQLEPGLFKKVTGLNVKEFNLLVTLNVFNASLMNDAIFKFKRYEDSSLTYTGINKHIGEDIGGWDTVIKRTEYETLFYNQQDTMITAASSDDDITDKPIFVDYVDEEDDIRIAAESKIYKKSHKKAIESKSKKYIDIVPKQGGKIELVTTSYGIKAPTNVNTIKEEKANNDYSYIKPGFMLVHKKFGKGTVIEIENDLMTVSFGKAEKRFQFPQAIENGYFIIK